MRIIFFGKGEYINIEKIPITPGLCNYALPKRQYGCTQPTKTKRAKIKRKMSSYRVTILAVAAQPPPKPTPDIQFFKSTAFKKESMPGTTN